jgi:hypothetical protein
LTAISPWNSSGGGNRAGTAITPRHIIYASHYKIPVGATVRFVTNDNEVVERNVVNIQSISSTDITIGTLDSNLPSTIKPVKFLPPDWSKYMAFDKNLKYGENAYLLKPRIPALCLDQEEKALIADVMGFTGGQATFTLPADVKMRQFNEQIVVGDSGNPSFFIIDNELVLITVWTFGGYGSGNFVSGVVYDTSTKTTKSVLKEINNLVLYVYGSSSTDLYTLDVVDLWKYRTV